MYESADPTFYKEFYDKYPQNDVFNDLFISRLSLIRIVIRLYLMKNQKLFSRKKLLFQNILLVDWRDIFFRGLIIQPIIDFPAVRFINNFPGEIFYLRKVLDFSRNAVSHRIKTPRISIASAEFGKNDNVT